MSYEPFRLLAVMLSDKKITKAGFIERWGELYRARKLAEYRERTGNSGAHIIPFPWQSEKTARCNKTVRALERCHE